MNKIYDEEFAAREKQAGEDLARQLMEGYEEVVGVQIREKAHQHLLNRGVQILHGCYDIDLDSPSDKQKQISYLYRLKIHYVIWADFLRRFTIDYQIDYRQESCFFEPDDILRGSIIDHSVGQCGDDPWSKTLLQIIKKEVQEKLNALRSVKFREPDQRLYVQSSDQESISFAFGNEVGTRPLKRSFPATHVIEFAVKRMSLSGGMPGESTILIKEDVWSYLCKMSGAFKFKGAFDLKSSDQQRKSLDRYFNLANKYLMELFPSIGSHASFTSEEADVGTVIFKM